MVMRGVRTKISLTRSEILLIMASLQLDAPSLLSFCLLQWCERVSAAAEKRSCLCRRKQLETWIGCHLKQEAGSSRSFSKRYIDAYSAAIVLLAFYKKLLPGESSQALELIIISQCSILCKVFFRPWARIARPSWESRNILLQCYWPAEIVVCPVSKSDELIISASRLNPTAIKKMVYNTAEFGLSGMV